MRKNLADFSSISDACIICKNMDHAKTRCNKYLCIGELSLTAITCFYGTATIAKRTKTVFAKTFSRLSFWKYRYIIQIR